MNTQIYLFIVIELDWRQRLRWHILPAIQVFIEHLVAADNKEVVGVGIYWLLVQGIPTDKNNYHQTSTSMRIEIPQLQCFSSRLVTVFSQSIESQVLSRE